MPSPTRKVGADFLVGSTPTRAARKDRRPRERPINEILSPHDLVQPARHRIGRDVLELCGHVLTDFRVSPRISIALVRVLEVVDPDRLVAGGEVRALLALTLHRGREPGGDRGRAPSFL